MHLDLFWDYGYFNTNLPRKLISYQSKVIKIWRECLEITKLPVVLKIPFLAPNLQKSPHLPKFPQKIFRVQKINKSCLLVSAARRQTGGRCERGCWRYLGPLQAPYTRGATLRYCHAATLLPLRSPRQVRPPAIRRFQQQDSPHRPGPPPSSYIS